MVIGGTKEKINKLVYQLEFRQVGGEKQLDWPRGFLPTNVA